MFSTVQDNTFHPVSYETRKEICFAVGTNPELTVFCYAHKCSRNTRWSFEKRKWRCYSGLLLTSPEVVAIVGASVGREGSVHAGPGLAELRSHMPLANRDWEDACLPSFTQCMEKAQHVHHLIRWSEVKWDRDPGSKNIPCGGRKIFVPNLLWSLCSGGEAMLKASSGYPQEGPIDIGDLDFALKELKLVYDLFFVDSSPSLTFFCKWARHLLVPKI